MVIKLQASGRSSLTARIALLPPADRMLFHLRVGRRLSLAECAVITGMSRGQISRRARYLYERLHSPEAHRLASLTEAHAGTTPPFSPIETRFAFYRFIAGLSVRRIGLLTSHNQSLVRKQLRRVRTWLATTSL